MTIRLDLSKPEMRNHDLMQGTLLYATDPLCLNIDHISLTLNAPTDDEHPTLPHNRPNPYPDLGADDYIDEAMLVSQREEMEALTPSA